MEMDDLKVENFWNWFGERQFELVNINNLSNSERDLLMDELEVKLHSYCSNLFFEIGGIEKQMELIITAEGDISYFNKVEKLVNKAPEILGWNFIALKPPHGTDFIMTYEGAEIDPKKLWFLPLENENHPGQIGLKIGVPVLNIELELIVLRTAIMKLIDSVIGEKMYSENIPHVSVSRMPDHPERKGFIELTELEEYIIWKKKKWAEQS